MPSGRTVYHIILVVLLYGYRVHTAIGVVETEIPDSGLPVLLSLVNAHAEVKTVIGGHADIVS